MDDPASPLNPVDAVEVQLATFNILEDFELEKQRIEQTQRATFNILEDFDLEKARTEGTQRATFNILEDFDTAKANTEKTQRATFNILADFEEEKARIEQAQRATFNILDDLQAEKSKMELAEHALAARTEDLSAANKELEAFAYSVSHDLRAPLRSMSGFAQILLEEHGKGLPADARHEVDMIVDSAREMGQLVDDLLAFSRLGKQPLELRQVNPEEMARRVYAELDGQRKGREVRIRFGPAPACEADPNLLKQVYVNLLGNALKYTRKSAPAEIEVGWTDHGGGAYFVKDNGVGFDMKHADNLFGVFQRLHRAEEYEGTGVGLAIVRRIVTRHGGRVWADAAIGQGATFFFTLPGGPP